MERRRDTRRPLFAIEAAYRDGSICPQTRRVVLVLASESSRGGDLNIALVMRVLIEVALQRSQRPCG